MNWGLVFRTVRYLRPTQVVYQVKNRLVKPAYVAMEAPALLYHSLSKGLKTEPIARWKCWDGEQFCFLNIAAPFTTWNETSHGMLWAYNLNYMDWLNQKGSSKEDCCFWIDKFISDLPLNKIGQDPYPIALRSINWVKVFIRWPDCTTKERKGALYSQLRLLERKLEYHLLANHLLEDAFALYIGAAYFNDIGMLKKASKLLVGQLEEQVLSDGGHYEQSVMYHCIMLNRLLDCINIGEGYGVKGSELREYAKRMVGWMKGMCYEDGTYPMFNDAAEGIAPRPAEIVDYARRLDIESEATTLGASGYRKLQNVSMEAFVDVGNITATYQPGHSHADTFNFELRIDGKPFLVDTGISTYDKNEHRQKERSTASHNTVVVSGQNSSEVWGGFRIGKRAKVTLLQNTPSCIKASHDGYGKNSHQRTFKMEDSTFVIEDETHGEAVGYLHFAPEVVVEKWDGEKLVTDMAVISLEDVDKVDMDEAEVSKEYHKKEKTTVVRLTFNKKMAYIISKR